MEFLDSLDLDTIDKKSHRVRSWYLYEQFKSLERSQLDAAQKLKDRSYQERILRQELSERRARRKLYDQFGLCQSESRLIRDKSVSNYRTTVSTSDDDFFESFYLLHEEEQVTQITGANEFSGEGDTFSQDCLSVSQCCIPNYVSVEDHNKDANGSYVGSVTSVLENLKPPNDEFLPPPNGKFMQNPIDEDTKSSIAEDINSSIAKDIKSSIAEDIKSSIAEDINSTIAEDIKSSIAEDIKSSIAEDINSTIAEDIKSSIAEDINSTIAEDIKSSIAEDIKSSIAEDINSTIAEDIKSSIAQDIKSSIAEDIKSSIAEDINSTIAEDIRSSIAEDINSAIADDIKSSIAEDIKNSIAEDLNMQFDSVKEDILCLEKIANLEDVDKISEEDSFNKVAVREHVTVSKKANQECNEIAIWSRLVSFAYQVLQFNHGNCYCDYSSQFLTAVLACDVLRRGVNRMCHILQPYVSPIEFASDDSDASDASPNLNVKRKKSVQSRKLRKICDMKPLSHKKTKNLFKTRGSARKCSSRHCSENWKPFYTQSLANGMETKARTCGGSEPWRGSAKVYHYGEEISPESSSSSTIWPDVLNKMPKVSRRHSYRYHNRALHPMLKIAQCIDSILKDIDDYKHV